MLIEIFDKITSRIQQAIPYSDERNEFLAIMSRLMNRINSDGMLSNIKDELYHELLFDVFYLKKHLTPTKNDRLLNKYFSLLIIEIISRIQSSTDERITKKLNSIVKENINNAAIDNYKNDITQVLGTEFNSYVMQLESKVKELDSNIKKQRNDAIKAFHDYELKISQLFKDNEDTSSNRIQVRLQDAESKINIMTRKFSQDVNDFEELLSEKREDIQKFSSQSKRP